MDQTAPRTVGPGLRVITGIIAALALLATLSIAGIALLGLLFVGLSLPSGHDGALFVTTAVLVAVPLLCLSTTVVAIIATVSGRRWAVIAAGILFATMIVGTVLLNLWIGAVG